jgi:hypothetical protein
MDTTHATPPALTPEEWARARQDDLPQFEGGGRVSTAIETAHLYSVRAWDLTPGDCHALAALALHGQPFGFTREEVAAIMTCVDVTREACVDAPTDAQSEREAAAWQLAWSAAAKLAALLPPE